LNAENITAIFQQVSAVESLKSVMSHVHFSTQGCCEISFQAIVSVGNMQHALNSHLPGNRVHAGLLFLVKAGKKKWQLSIRILEPHKKHIPPNDAFASSKSYDE